MKSIICFILLSLFITFLCGAGFAVDSEKDGCMKISIDSLAMFGGGEKEDEDRPEHVDDATDEEKYTYNAMGEKVPTRTER